MNVHEIATDLALYKDVNKKKNSNMVFIWRTFCCCQFMLPVWPSG